MTPQCLRGAGRPDPPSMELASVSFPEVTFCRREPSSQGSGGDPAGLRQFRASAASPSVLCGDLLYRRIAVSLDVAAARQYRVSRLLVQAEDGHRPALFSQLLRQHLHPLETAPRKNLFDNYKIQGRLPR